MHIFAVINILYIVAFESDKNKLGIFVGIKPTAPRNAGSQGQWGE